MDAPQPQILIVRGVERLDGTAVPAPVVEKVSSTGVVRLIRGSVSFDMDTPTEVLFPFSVSAAARRKTLAEQAEKSETDPGVVTPRGEDSPVVRGW